MPQRQVILSDSEVDTIMRALYIHEATLINNSRVRPSERAMELASIQQVKEKLSGF